MRYMQERKMRKVPVSIGFTPRLLARIDQEARAQKRSRSEWLELHFEEFFKLNEKEEEIALKFGR
jgi:hypothetical protein